MVGLGTGVGCVQVFVFVAAGEDGIEGDHRQGRAITGGEGDHSRGGRSDPLLVGDILLFAVGGENQLQAHAGTRVRSRRGYRRETLFHSRP